MFKIVATIYLMLNGQPAGDPKQLSNKMTFETIEACKTFQTSEKGSEALENLHAMLKQRLPTEMTFTVTVGCEPVGDDGSI